MSNNRKPTPLPEEIAGREPKPIWLVVATLGLLMVAVGTLLPIFNIYEAADPSYFYRYIYTAGAVFFLVAKLMTPYTGTHQRIKRLYRIEAWSGVFFCVAAFFLFYDQGDTRNWLAFTLAGGVIMIFTSIAIPMAIKKAIR